MRWVILLAAVGGVMFGMARWLTRPAIHIDTFVETPEVWEKMYSQYDGIMSDQMRVTPRVDLNAAETVIQWPAFRSKKVAAVPLELRIRKGQWGDKYQLGDRGFIGPDAVGLRLEWPESDEERAKAPAGEATPLVIYMRSGSAIRDFLYDEAYRADKAIKYATPLEAPREEAVVIYCSSYGTDCNMRFEYLGRSVEVKFPRRRFDAWEQAHQGAQRLLAAIAKPIPRK